MSETPTPIAPESALTPMPVNKALPAWRRPGWPWRVTAVVSAALAVVAMVGAYNTHTHVKAIEQTLVKRQQDNAGQAAEARVLAREANEASRDAAAKVALLDARVSESALQRTQLEELIQSLSRSRDENVLADLEAGLRVAQQQSAITGSVEPLVSTLKQADERLARYNQPRLDRVRRAVARDLDRVKGTSATDVSTLTIRLDEVVRMVDELPLLATASPLKGRALDRVPAPASTPAGAKAAPARAASAAEPATGVSAWWATVRGQAGYFAGQAWDEVRALVRVTRIEHPEAVLMAPDQAYFVRENFKLRLLNARLGLLSRQFDSAQSDLRDAEQVLDRYFDRSSRRVVTVGEQLKQVAAQAKQVTVPRPDETLAALAAATAGR